MGAIAFQMAPLLVNAALVIAAFTLTGAGRELRRGSHGTDWAVLLVVVVALGAAVSARAHFFATAYLPSWDSFGYLAKTQDLLAVAERSVPEAAAALYQSILDSDYNDWLALSQALPVSLDPSLEGFCLSTFLLYLVPSAIVSGAGAWTLARREGRVPGFATCVLPFMCLPVFLTTVLDGYVDAAALVPASVCLLVAATGDLGERQRVGASILLGLSLALMVIMRRYFAYFAVGFLALCAVVAAFDSLGREDATERFQAWARNVGLAYLVAGGVLAGGFWGLVERSLDGNYGEAYSAYSNAGDILAHLRLLAEQIGPVAVVALVACLVACVARQQSRGWGLGLAALVAVSMLLFWRTQDPYNHHLYVVATAAGYLMVLALSPATERGRIRARVLTCGALATLLAFAVIPEAEATPAADVLVGNVKCALYPRDDADQICALYESLPSGSRTYVLASSETLNSSMLRRLDGPAKILPTSDVDLRDGFPMALFDADYVVCCTPVQTHLHPTAQRTVTALSSMVVSPATCIGRHFVPVATWELSGGVTATVYQRTSDWEPADYAELQALYDGWYPDSPELFHDRLEALLA